MDRETEEKKARGGWMRRFTSLAGAAAILLVAASTHGQQNPTKQSGHARPFIMFLMDSSASMEWTSEGAGEYPKRDYGAFTSPTGTPLKDPMSQQPDQWDPRYDHGVHAEHDDENESDGAKQEWDDHGHYEDDWKDKCLNDSSHDHTDKECNPLYFGSCMVWEPPCNEWDRPSWNPSWNWTPHYDDDKEMGERFRKHMRGKSDKWDEAYTGAEDEKDFPIRLLNHSQPRHVTFKEILTGEMVLLPEDKIDKDFYDPNDSADASKTSSIESVNYQKYGPGCWWVPRQRGASYIKDPICCKSESGGKCDTPYESYDRYPDHDDPRPHLQEVYDGQIGNGLMDNLSGKVQFGVTAFDSYKWPMDGKAKAAHGSGIDEEDTLLWNPNGLEDMQSGSFGPIDESASDTYNLGVFQIVTADEFPAETRYVSDISEITQVALKDSGTLKKKAYSDAFNMQSTKNDDFFIDPPPETNVPDETGLSLNKDIDNYSKSTLLSRQPIAKNTPLAPAIYDIQNWFADSNSPIVNDNFRQCRPKHVVMMTDGVPLPERPKGASDGRCEAVGTEGLSEAFRMNPNKYDYRCTEEMIRDFVSPTDTSKGTVSPYWVSDDGNNESARYNPRVHVLGMDISQQDASEQSIKKMASMARAGQTCAGWYLGNRTSSEQTACGDVPSNKPWLPLPSKASDCRTNPSEPCCKKPDHPCLVEQYDNGNEPDSFVSFDQPGSCPPSGWAGCKYPALVLQCNTIQENKDYYSSNPLPTGVSTAEEAARQAYRECRSGKWYAQAMQQILNSILKSAGLASRTRPAIANELDDKTSSSSSLGGTNPRGQYRLYSGTRVEASFPIWRGVLIRETRMCKGGKPTVSNIPDSDKDTPCASGNEYYECFHENIGDQLVRPGDGKFATEDNRRIFTSVPSDEVYDASQRKATPQGGSCGHYASTYFMNKTDNHGDFQASYLKTKSGSGGVDEMLNHRRVPLEYGTLKEAMVETGLLGGVTDLLNKFNLGTESQLKDLINSYRARTGKRDGRELAAILSSNPVAVEPPKENVPIESYREFKTRFSNRPTMLYFGTLDGMLHATYTGVLDDADYKVKVRSGMSTSDDVDTKYNSLSPTNGAAKEQREAWAYMPNMVLDEMADYEGVNPNMMDGSPVVKDVRLCHSNLKYNQNYQACRVICSQDTDLDNLCTTDDADCVPPEMQWRTVLVEGLGQAGSGYFALDVTRPGGPHVGTDTNGNVTKSIKRPDPIPLWEFDPTWEAGQVEYMTDSSSSYTEDGESLTMPPSHSSKTSMISECSTDTSSSDYFWRQPFLGESVSDPAIGTVIMPPPGGGSEPIRRPVAVFGGGASGPYGPECDRSARSGKAIYVVDLQTGSIIRRFVGFWHNGNWHKFDSPVMGSPTLHSNSPGTLATRGFIGDGEGRLFRIDLTDSNASVDGTSFDPEDWKVTLFFDPGPDGFGKDILPSGTSTSVGPASVKPAVALGNDDNLTVVYGLGQPGDKTSDKDLQALITLEETTAAQKGDAQADMLWHIDSETTGVDFSEREKLTAEPVIFNQNVYFTTYFLDDNAACALGNSKIWGLQLEQPSDLKNWGVFDCTADGLKNLSSCDSKFFSPDNRTMIRGLTITLGPQCSVSGTSRSSASMMEEANQEPKLVAQTGGAAPGTDSSSTSSGSGTGTESDFINRLDVGIEAPRSQMIPMSWSVVDQ